MLRRSLPVEYSYSIKDSFYLKMCISFLFFVLFFFFSKSRGRGRQPLPLRGPCIFPLFTFHLSGAHIFEQIWRPFLMKFQLEGFFLLLTVSSNREWSALDFILLGTVPSPRLHLYHSQLIKKLEHANNKLSTLSSNRASSVKVRKCK